MQVRLLGTVELVADDGDVVPIGAAQRRAVLATLASSFNSPVSATRLIDIVWEGDPPPQARTALQVHISGLRKLLVSDVQVQTRAGGYQLTGGRAAVDAVRFGDLVSGSGDADDAAAARTLRAALDLWRGPALADVSAVELQETVASRLEDARLTALEALADRLIRLGRSAELVPELMTAAERHPLREPLAGALMLSMYAAGRPADALLVYDRTRRRLADTLGVDPSLPLQQAYQSVLSQRPPATFGADVPVADTDAVPQRALMRFDPVVPSQLPRFVSRFRGRREQLAWLDRMMTEGHDRLVVVGPAGVGKTALVTHWAHQVADRFPDGQVFVNLHGFDDSDPRSTETAIAAILSAFGVTGGAMPQDLAAQVALYRQLIQDRRMLVVLDNARGAEQVRPLLPTTRLAMTVVTSRRHMDGLVVHEGAAVLPLGALTEPESIELLAEMIGERTVRAEPDAVTRLTRLCERLPLALRIAAAHVANQGDQRLANVVGELSDEHNRLAALSTVDADVSVSASLSASCRSLSEPAARLFALLAVHPGADVSVPAAAALAGTDLAAARRSLAELTAVHLLDRTGFPRYTAHDLVRLYSRDFARDRIAAPERAAAFGRLIHYYVAATASMRKTLTNNTRDANRPEQAWAPHTVPAFDSTTDALSWFAVEEPTIRSLVVQAPRYGHGSGAWRLAVNADVGYMWSGSAARFVAAMEAGVAGALAAGDEFGLMTVKRSLAVSYTDIDELELARQTYADSLAIADTLPDPLVLQARVARIGLIRTLMQSEPEDIVVDRSLIENSVVSESEDPYLAVMRLWMLAVTLVQQGNSDGTLALVEEATAIADLHSVAAVRHQLRYARGRVLTAVGDPDAAVIALREAIDLCVAWGDGRTQAWCEEALGDAWHARGRADEADDHWRTAAAMYDRLGSARGRRLGTRLARSAR